MPNPQLFTTLTDGTNSYTVKDATARQSIATLEQTVQNLGIDGLADTNISNIQNKQSLVYDAENDEWINSNVATAEWVGTTAELEQAILDGDIEDDTNILVTDDADSGEVIVVTVPTVTGTSFTYNGSAQGPTITDLDTFHTIVSGDTATDAGTYTLTIALENTKRQVWSDGTSAPKTFTYTINKATQSLTLSKNSVSLNGNTLSDTVTVSGNQGNLSITSSDLSVVTAALSGSTVTISSVNNKTGTATVTVTAVETQNYLEISEPISVDCEFLKIVTWADGTDAEIAAMLDAHYNGTIDIHDHWSVGDERTVHLNAMAATGVGESHVAQDVTMVLMNAGGKTLTTPIGSVTECAFIVGQKNMLATGTTREGGYMNSSDTNTGGWEQCARRTWCNNVYKAALPSTFVGILKQHQNITAAGTGSTTTTSSDYVALPAEKEVFGSVSYADSTAEASLTQFKYYETASNRIKNQGNAGSVDIWWERSPLASGGSRFCRVNSDGTAFSASASFAFGLAPFFCI